MSQAVSPTPFAGLVIAVSVEDDGWRDDGLGDLDLLLRGCFAATAIRAGLSSDLRTELGATFTNDAAVRRLNAEWRGMDRPTNVLSFPLADLAPGEAPGAMLGDLVFARETLLREAAAEGKALRHHLCHLAVHGVLHCLGHDHGDAEEAEAMERLEVLILADLGIPDPYAASEPAATAADADRWAR